MEEKPVVNLFIVLKKYWYKFLNGELLRSYTKRQVRKYYQDGSDKVREVIQTMRDAQQHGGQLQSYLDEKLAASQIRWIDHSISSGAARYKPDVISDSGCIQVQLGNVLFRYWNLVILPNLMHMIKQWNCQMYYDIEPDREVYEDTRMLRTITLNVWMFERPYKVKRHRKFHVAKRRRKIEV
jgi:hypothetical protein